MHSAARQQQKWENMVSFAHLEWLEAMLVLLFFFDMKVSCLQSAKIEQSAVSCWVTLVIL